MSEESTSVAVPSKRHRGPTAGLTGGFDRPINVPPQSFSFQYNNKYAKEMGFSGSNSGLWFLITDKKKLGLERGETGVNHRPFGHSLRAHPMDSPHFANNNSRICQLLAQLAVRTSVSMDASNSK